VAPSRDGWLPPKLRPAARHLSTGHGRRDTLPLTRAQTEEQARLAQHGACVDHVKVAGLANRVCVLRGQDPEAVAAEAALLAGLVDA